MKRRRGFTLVELLVVIAIIAILVVLLLPAVQAARESARRSQCMNHIRNLALGFHNHESAHGFFPSAGGPDWTHHMTYVKGVPAVAPDQHGGWGFQILPFVEMNEVWVGPQGATNMEKSIHAISTPLPFMFCPSRREPEVVVAGDWLQSPGNSGKSFGHAKNDYAASSHDSTERFPRGIGMVTQMQPVYVKQVTDGLSKTLLLAEKQMNVQLLGQMQANDNEGYTCGWNHDIDAIHQSPAASRFPSFGQLRVTTCSVRRIRRVSSPHWEMHRFISCRTTWSRKYSAGWGIDATACRST